jgi:hypothetical protein
MRTWQDRRRVDRAIDHPEPIDIANSTSTHLCAPVPNVPTLGFIVAFAMDDAQTMISDQPFL